MNSPADEKVKRIGILQPGYLPWLGFFEQIGRVDAFIIYDDVQFDKGGWRNRNRVKSPNGPAWLTVPVLTKGQGNLNIRDIQISQTERWSSKHIRTIQQYYSRADYYEYTDELFQIWESQWEFLIDLDIAIIRWMAEKFGLSTQFYLSSDLNIQGDRIQRLINIIKHLDGNVFYEGAAGKNYIDIQNFREHGIEVEFQDYSHPVYSQLHGEFISHLSALDLLLNCGPDSRGILMLEGDVP
jgi:hypothetical protein